MADNEIYRMGKYAFKCKGCGRVEGGFDTEAEAKIALQLHKIGCKKS
jgi:hypothetical protein